MRAGFENNTEIVRFIIPKGNEAKCLFGAIQNPVHEPVSTTDRHLIELSLENFSFPLSVFNRF